MSSPLNLAVQMLSKREHTRNELRQKLQRHDFTLDDIEAAINHLTESGLQSDDRFAQMYVKQKQRQFGDWRLRAELAQRGIEDTTIDAAMWADCWQPESERLTDILKLKYPLGIPPQDTQKAQRFLRQRGFADDACYRALKNYQSSCN